MMNLFVPGLSLKLGVFHIFPNRPERIENSKSRFIPTLFRAVLSCCLSFSGSILSLISGVFRRIFSIIFSRKTILLLTLPVISEVVNCGDGSVVSSDEKGDESSADINILCPELVMAIGSPGVLSPYILRSAELGWYPWSFLARGEFAGTIAVIESVDAGSISSTIFLSLIH